MEENIIVLKSSCDDSMFMTSEIVIEYDKKDNLGGVSLELHTQSGGRYSYLREGEIEELITNLQTILELIKNDNKNG